MTDLLAYKNFLFDLDGTLMNTESVHYYCLRELFKQFDFQLPLDEAAFRGQSDMAIFKKYLPHIDPQILVQKKHDFFNQALTTSSDHLLTDGLIAFLDYLSFHKKTCAVVTSSSRKECDRLLHMTQLKKYFVFEITRDDVTSPKPSPTPYLMALRKLNSSPEEALVFEDSLIGYTAATAAGITCHEIYTHKGMSEWSGTPDFTSLI
jgi:beta-phosphoglucomutase